MTQLTQALFNSQLPDNLAASQQLNRKLLDLVAQLEQRVAELEENIGSSSRNSSKPPSQDSAQQRAKREKKTKSNRKKGGQPGHPGHQRAPVDASSVDAHIHYYPDTQCACGALCHISQEPTQRISLYISRQAIVR